MNAQDFYQRRAGVLLHPTSLPSGVLDGDVERWLDLLAIIGFNVWQMLPLGEPQEGLSPYQCVSAFAMNPALLHEYSPVDTDNQAFIEFCDAQEWLDDYALFKVLKQKFDDAPWCNWPDKYKHRHSHELLLSVRQYSEEISRLKWQQFELFKRWQQIKNYATNKNILLFGDMPLFVAYDSVEVWATPERFMLNKAGIMEVITGVPPDYYSDTGQRWGNPHYDWTFMRSENYAWWLLRIQQHLQVFDLIRIDHFRGLESAWVINASCETAIDGHWEKMPGDELLSYIEQITGRLPIVTEDLGVITEEVKALRKKYNLPGMAVLQFGFDEHPDNPHKVENIEEDCVVYTGTHDNDTSRGWFESLDEATRDHVLDTLKIDKDNVAPCQVVNKLINMAMNSRASICILPLQDILCLETSNRMNMPGTTTGNWRWSFKWEQIENTMIDAMKQVVADSDRLVSDDV